MNKEAELPKSIDFSQLPEALRAFKAGEGRARAHAHTYIHTHMHTCADTHVCTHREAERERFKSERIMAPALAVSLKTQFGSSRFLPDKRTHSEPAKVLFPCARPATMMAALAPAPAHARFCAHAGTLNVSGLQRRQKPPGARARRGRKGRKGKEKSLKKLLIVKS